MQTLGEDSRHFKQVSRVEVAPSGTEWAKCTATRINTRSRYTVCDQTDKPVQNLTSWSDIEKLIKHIDKMLEPGQDKGKEERIIRAG